MPRFFVIPVIFTETEYNRLKRAAPMTPSGRVDSALLRTEMGYNTPHPSGWRTRVSEERQSTTEAVSVVDTSQQVAP